MISLLMKHYLASGHFSMLLKHHVLKMRMKEVTFDTKDEIFCTLTSDDFINAVEKQASKVQGEKPHIINACHIQ